MSLKVQQTKSGNILQPAFFPDATHAVIRGVGVDELEKLHVDGLVINTYHLLNTGMVEVIEKYGGIHKFLNYDKPVITDSGGFQVMSLIRKNLKNGSIQDNQIIFKLEGTNKKLILTPENCIQTQVKLGSDIVMCLDDCTDPQDNIEQQIASVDRTIRWALRCKNEFVNLTSELKQKPLLFAIIQGGNDKNLRKKCAEALIEIGFDGFAYGGWPMDGEQGFMGDILAYTASLMPDDKPKYAMGVGMPEDILKCYDYGFTIFDCVLPTRDARHKRLYRYKNEVPDYEFVYLGSGKHKLASEPISDKCDCVTCENYSLGYLYHLFKLKDALSVRLSTIHNLRFYSMLMEYLRSLSQ